MPEALHIQPKLGLSFDEALWNKPDIRLEANCLAHAFDSPDLLFAWFDDINGITLSSENRYDETAKALETAHAIEEHPGFTRLHKHEIDPAKHHIFALQLYDVTHAFRYNAENGVWSEKKATRQHVVGTTMEPLYLI